MPHILHCFILTARLIYITIKRVYIYNIMVFEMAWLDGVFIKGQASQFQTIEERYKLHHTSLITLSAFGRDGPLRRGKNELVKCVSRLHQSRDQWHSDA